jgi:hypothetical protein
VGKPDPVNITVNVMAIISASIVSHIHRPKPLLGDSDAEPRKDPARPKPNRSLRVVGACRGTRNHTSIPPLVSSATGEI